MDAGRNVFEKLTTWYGHTFIAAASQTGPKGVIANDYCAHIIAVQCHNKIITPIFATSLEITLRSGILTVTSAIAKRYVLNILLRLENFQQA